MTLERVHPQPLRPWRGPGRWLVLPHLLKGWQRRPSRLPHHSPLFRTERGAAPYKHRRRCEWAEETWPWASPACFSLGDVGGRDCQPVPDGGAPRPHPSSAAHTLSSSRLLSHSWHQRTSTQPSLLLQGHRVLLACLRPAGTLCLERSWLLPSVDNASPALSLWIVIWSFGKCPQPCTHPPRLPESHIPLQLTSHASDKFLHLFHL